jgi:membrane-bound serine protease (ClpP class)
VFLIVALVLVLVLPSPWNLVAFAISLSLFVGEVLFWNRRVRDKRVSTGAETMIGASATVVRACRPHGQVRISGETWDARCEDGADPGEAVVVVARDGLVLVVERAVRE